MIIRSLLILPFSLCLFVPVQAMGCELVSEIDPDVFIRIKEKDIGGWGANGKLYYKKKPQYIIRFGIQMGYGGQNFNIGTLEKKHIGGGRFVGFVGDQVGRGTPKDKRKPGQRRGLMPTLGQKIYYHLDPADRRFNLFDSDIALLNASEGFFKIGDKCRKVFPYIGWAD